MSTKIQLTGGAFQDPSGNPLANGYLLLLLSQDAQVDSDQIAAGRELKISLDQNGNIVTSPAQYVWPNDVLTPANTFYTVSAYTAEGQLVWGPNSQQVFSSPSPYDVGVWVPGIVNTIVTQVVTYDVGSFYPGVIALASTLITRLALERTVRFAVNLAPSTAVCGTAPTSTAIVTLYQNGTQFASVTFTPGSTVGTLSSAAGATFHAGDVLSIEAPSAVDGTLADVGIVLSGVVL